MVERKSDSSCLEASVLSNSPGRTRDIAAVFGALCRGGEVLLLHGDLGAGKTCFTQGLSLGLGIPPEIRVTSPTFTLHGEYRGRLVLNHLDLYRLEHSAALESLGIEEMIADPGAVTAVEWPELMEHMAADERLDVRIEDQGEGVRKLTFSASGPLHRRLLASWLDTNGTQDYNREDPEARKNTGDSHLKPL